MECQSDCNQIGHGDEDDDDMEEDPEETNLLIQEAEKPIEESQLNEQTVNSEQSVNTEEQSQANNVEKEKSLDNFLQDKSEFTVLRPVEHNSFVLELMQSKSFKQKNVVSEYTYRVRPKYPAEEKPLNDLLPQLKGLFESLLDEIKKAYGQTSKVRVFIQHEELKKEIIVKPTVLAYLTSDSIIQRIENVLYSAGFIPADEKLQINVACAQFKPITGKGRRSIVNVERDTIAKRSFVKIRNDDNLCLPRAIVVGLAHLRVKKNPLDHEACVHYRKIRDYRRSFQFEEAKKLRDAVKLPDRESTIKDVKIYEEFLDTSIVVHSASIGNKRVYNGLPNCENRIFLYHSERDGVGHFDTITKVNAMMNTQYYCNDCGKGFKNATKHSCRVWCNVCGRTNCQDKKHVTCIDCNKSCRSQECYEAHKKMKVTGRGINKGLTLPSNCDQFWECPDCAVTLKRDERSISQHNCGEKKCKVCQQYFSQDEKHYCYMRAMTNESSLNKFLFYDFECQQHTGQHKPNYVVAHSICSFCEHEEVNEFSICVYCGSRCNKCDSFNTKENEFEKYPCYGCGKRQVIFSGENTSEEFCQWLFQVQHKNFTVIAHNARAYDAYFIYEYLMKNAVIPDPVIFSGSKIMYMKIGKGLNIRLLDSLNFLPMSLSKLPASFGFEEKKKGFFPHLFNIPENENKILTHLPDVKYYDPDGMSNDKRQEFLKWYSENYNREFDFQKEIKDYCISDVDILLNACWKFRKLVMKETSNDDNGKEYHDLMLDRIMQKGIDPLSFLTIASVCMGIFRSKFLTETWSVLTKENASKNMDCKHEENCTCVWLQGRKLCENDYVEVLVDDVWINIDSLNVAKKKFVKSPIGLIPTHGYAGSDNHSKESLQWLYALEWEFEKKGKQVQIQHARSPKGEKVITYRYKRKKESINYKVDGYFELDGKKYVCEFNGCSWHGCPDCYPSDRENIMNNEKSLGQRFRDTKLKEKRLTEMGYHILTMWSCQFVKDCKNDEELKNFVSSLNIQDPLNVRDAYFGGRTNALVLHKVFKNGEVGYYLDYTSLYPDVLKYKRFPVGHPKRILTDFENPDHIQCDGKCLYYPCNGVHQKLRYFGLIKATILPPTDLIHPVLPVRCNGKLKFPLCYTCAVKADIHTVCQCSESERMFIGTYCSPELEVALNMGYRVIQYHEILHWEESEIYDSKTKKGGLFTDYINTFLKLKQQASGFPNDVQTEEQKDSYIDQYLEHEGILLNKDSIVKNPGLRSISKLALNSFYGKFGQRTNLKKTKFVTDVGELYNIFLDPTKEVSDFHLMNEDIVEIEFTNSSEFEGLSIGTNSTIAAFCTSWGRLKLWSEMNKLGDRVLYHDTDSIIFSVNTNINQYIPSTGDYLGELTNELTCKEVGCKNLLCTGHWIEEFVSCGPKNYAFRLNTGQIVCKVRGFTLNYHASQIINFQSMKDSLFAWKNKQPDEVVIVKTEILRDKHTTAVYNRVMKKHYSVVYDKRKVLDNLTTVPFGFRN